MWCLFSKQKVALETIIHAANKKDKCTGVLQSGVEILKKLYKSSNDHIKIRALVGLCKLGSYGGTDYGLQAFSEGSTLKLSKEVQRSVAFDFADLHIILYECYTVWLNRM